MVGIQNIIQQAHGLSREPCLPWIQDLRSTNLQVFEDLGLPTKKQENWRFTNFQDFIGRPLKPPLQKSQRGPLPTLDKIAHNAKHLLVFVDGQYAKELSRTAELPKEVVIKSLADCLESEAEIDTLRPYLSHHKTKDSFTALNSAFLKQGLYIHIPKSLVVPDAIYICHIFTKKFKDSMEHIQHILVFGEQSTSTIFECYASEENHAYMSNVITDLYLEQAATVDHIQCQVQGNMAWHMDTTRAQVAKDANYRSLVFHLGGKLSRNNLDINLNGEGASTEALGLYALKDEQQSDHYTQIFHNVPHTTSEQIYKGILDDRAKGVFSGKIHVKKDAQQTNSTQMNKNLLLNRTAHVHTLPQLCIDADDVKCAHGATIGQLNEDEIFYFESRGIPAEKAKRILTFAFANDIMLKIRDENLQKKLKTFLENKFYKGKVFL